MVPATPAFVHPASTRRKAKAAIDKGLSLRKAGAEAGVAHTVVAWWRKNGGFDNLGGDPDATADDEATASVADVATRESPRGAAALAHRYQRGAGELADVTDSPANVSTAVVTDGTEDVQSADTEITDAEGGINDLPAKPDGWAPTGHAGLRAFYRYVNGLLSHATPANALRAAQVIDPKFALTQLQHTAMLDALTKMMLSERIVFGDSAGHDFHGNQWTGGIGGGATGGSSGTGTTTADGVLHTDNVDAAATALANGQKVELQQPREVSTLLDKLAAQAQAAQAAGVKAAPINLALCSVKGTNLFATGNKGIARIDMPQLSTDAPVPGSLAAKVADAHGRADLTQPFIDSLRASGVSVTAGKEQASYLRATQSELGGRQVGGMMNAIEAGRAPGLAERTIVVSRDNYILDGHHTWAAVVGINARDNNLANDPAMNIDRVDLSITDLLTRARDYAAAQGIPATVVHAAEVHFGDAAGHDFHGNQHTGGIGGEASLPGPRAGRLPGTSSFTREGTVALRDQFASVTPTTLSRSSRFDTDTVYNREAYARALAGEGTKFASAAEAEVYANGVLHKYGGSAVAPDEKVAVDFGLAPRTASTTIVGGLHHQAITLGDEMHTQAVVLHELGHVLSRLTTADASAGRPLGYVGHGQSFRDAYLPLLAEMPAFRDVMTGHGLGAGEPMKTALIMTEQPPGSIVMAELYNGDGTLLERCYAPAPGDNAHVTAAHFGDVSGHDFHGNQHTGGLGGGLEAIAVAKYGTTADPMKAQFILPSGAFMKEAPNGAIHEAAANQIATGELSSTQALEAVKSAGFVRLETSKYGVNIEMGQPLTPAQMFAVHAAAQATSEAIARAGSVLGPGVVPNLNIDVGVRASGDPFYTFSASIDNRIAMGQALRKANVAAGAPILAAEQLSALAFGDDGPPKPVTFGDSPGHDFHGNQHTGGLGAEGATNRTDTRTMATEATPGGPLFHGTNAQLTVGGVIQSSQRSGLATTYGDAKFYSPQHVYASTQPFLAGRFAYGRAKRIGGEPHVYRVEPLSPPQRDPEFVKSGGFGSDQWVTSAARVVGEVDKQAWGDTRMEHQELHFGDSPGHDFHGNQHTGGLGGGGTATLERASTGGAVPWVPTGANPSLAEWAVATPADVRSGWSSTWPVSATAVQQDIANRSGLSLDTVRGFANAWNGDALSEEGSAALQQYAGEKFGIPLTPRAQSVTDYTLSGHSQKSEAAIANAPAMLDAQYAVTQKFYADRGITEVHAFRGISGEFGGGTTPGWHTTAVADAPLGAWTLDQKMAEDFAHNVHGTGPGGTGYLMAATIPASSIVSNGTSGMGVASVAEIIVASHPGTVAISRLGSATLTYAEAPAVLDLTPWANWLRDLRAATTGPTAHIDAATRRATFGDVAGHDFRGNQYIDVGGGSGGVGIASSPTAWTSGFSSHHLEVAHGATKDTLHAARTQTQRDYLHHAMHVNGEADHAHWGTDPHHGDIGFGWLGSEASGEWLIFAPIAPPAYVRSVYDQYAMSDTERTALQGYLRNTYHDSALMAVNDNLTNLGRDAVTSITDSGLLASFADRAAAAADGIASTWNSDLAASVGSDWLSLAAERGNQMSRQWLDDSTSQWVADRADWKAQSILLNESGQAYQDTQSAWLSNNSSVVQQARVVPDTGACVLPDCLVEPIGVLGAAMRSRYDGPLVVIRTASGVVLRVTPKHPVLTGRGWLAAEEVCHGDYVFRVTADGHGAATVHSDGVPATVAEVFASLRSRAVRREVTPQDFHGDGARMQGEVEVVRANRGLGGVGDAHGNPEGLKFRLAGPLSALGRPRPRTVSSHALADFGGMGEAVGGPAATDRRVGSAGAEANTSTLHSPDESAPMEPQHGGDDRRRQPASIQVDHLRHVDLDMAIFGVRGLRPDPHSGSMKVITEQLARLADIPGDAIDGLSGLVSLDQVIEVRDDLETRHGYVYNLGTSSHAFVADGIIVHNCNECQDLCDQYSEWDDPATSGLMDEEIPVHINCVHSVEMSNDANAADDSLWTGQDDGSGDSVDSVDSTDTSGDTTGDAAPADDTADQPDQQPADQPESSGPGWLSDVGNAVSALSHVDDAMGAATDAGALDIGGAAVDSSGVLGGIAQADADLQSGLRVLEWLRGNFSDNAIQALTNNLTNNSGLSASQKNMIASAAAAGFTVGDVKDAHKILHGVHLGEQHFGDSAGHDFHGNQHTGGIGGGGATGGHSAWSNTLGVEELCTTASLTSGQQYALSHYGAPDIGRSEAHHPSMVTSRDINDLRRSGIQPHGCTVDAVHAVEGELDSALANSRVTTNTDTWRGIAAGTLPSLAPGTEFVDKGYATLGGDQGMAENFPVETLNNNRGYGPNTSVDDPVMHITIPAGAQALDHHVDSSAVGGPVYSEWVLPHDTTFRVTGSEGTSAYGRPIIGVTVVPPHV